VSEEEPPTMSFFLGIELGQVSDVTALAVVES
jgi:hypothetical protein